MAKMTREQWLIVLAPCLAVLAFYSIFNRQGEIRDAKQRLTSMRTTAVSPSEVVAKREELSKQADQLRELETRKTELQKRWSQLVSSRTHPPKARARVFQELAAVLWKHGLVTVEESFVGAGEARLPESLNDAMQKMTAAGTAAEPRVWKVNIVGRYADVLAMLKAVADDNSLPVLPVGITMSDASRNSVWRSWTLLFWM